MTFYEIHVSIHLQNGKNELDWILWCKENNLKYIRVLNTTGLDDVQNMIAYYFKTDTEKEAIKEAHKMETKIIDGGFVPIRVKVEAMMNSEKYSELILEQKNNKYFEYHIKTDDQTDLKRLENYLKTSITKKEYQTIGLSFSVYGRSRCPIITLRSYSGKKDDIEKWKNYIVEKVSSEGFKLKLDCIQSEIAIYDTYIELDAGWKI